MSRFIVPVLAALLASSPALAQSFTINPSPGDGELRQAFGAEPFLRVQVTFRVPLQPIGTDAAADAAMLEGARKSLYGQAQRECAVLAEQYKADCRLVTLNVNTGSVVVPNNPQPPQINAFAAYVLKVK